RVAEAIVRDSRNSIVLHPHHKLRPEMQLSREDRKRLREALQDAFPTYDELRIMVGEATWLGDQDFRLEQISHTSNQSIVIYNLIDWAVRYGQLASLIHNALHSVPHNEKLQSLATHQVSATSVVSNPTSQSTLANRTPVGPGVALPLEEPPRSL